MTSFGFFRGDDILSTFFRSLCLLDNIPPMQALGCSSFCKKLIKPPAYKFMQLYILILMILPGLELQCTKDPDRIQLYKQGMGTCFSVLLMRSRSGSTNTPYTMQLCKGSSEQGSFMFKYVLGNKMV